MSDGYDGPMNGTQRGFPLVACPAHQVWHRSNVACVACRVQRDVDRLKAQLEKSAGGVNGATGK